MPIPAPRPRRRCSSLAKAGGLALALSTPLLLSPTATRAQTTFTSLRELFGEPVTDSVTGSPQRASDAPADIEIITAEDIRRSGGQDIPDVLRHVAGLDVLQWDANHADVAIRGYNQSNSPRLLVLIDGRQVYENFYNHTDWRTLPVEMAQIDRIEVVRGPNSALFGFNAVGGVINIITHDPLETQVNAASVTGGTQATWRGSAVMSGKLAENIGVRLAFGGGQNSDFGPLRSSLEPGPISDARHGEVNLTAQIALPHDISLYLEGTHSSARYYAMLPTYTVAYEQPQASSIKARLSADTAIGVVGVSAYRNWTRVQVETGGFDNRVRNEVTVLEAHDIVKLPANNTLRVSLEYRHNTADTIPLGGANVFYNIASAAGMWDWKISPTVSLTNAVRLDRFSLGRNGSTPPGYGLPNSAWDRRTTEVSYNSGLVWRLGDADVLRLMAARGVQVPSLYTFGAIAVPVGPMAYIGGLPSTSITAVENYEARWDRTLAGSALHIQAAVFHNRSSPVVAGAGGSVPSANIFNTTVTVGRSESTGLDLSLAGQFQTNWRWGFSYTPQVVTDHFRPDLPVSATLLDYKRTHPTHVVNANLGWARGPWEVDGYARFESRFQGVVGEQIPAGRARLTPIPAHLTLDGRAAYRMNDRFVVAVSGQDLAVARQVQTSGPKIERRLMVTLSAAF